MIPELQNRTYNFNISNRTFQMQANDVSQFQCPLQDVFVLKQGEMYAVCARGSVWTVLFDEKTNKASTVHALLVKIMQSKTVLESDDCPEYLLSVGQGPGNVITLCEDDVIARIMQTQSYIDEQCTLILAGPTGLKLPFMQVQLGQKLLLPTLANAYTVMCEVSGVEFPLFQAQLDRHLLKKAGRKAISKLQCKLSDGFDAIAVRVGSTLEFKIANGLVKRLDVYTLQISFREKCMCVTDNFG